ncbi:MAG TPA: asparagine synthase (glutamine-hydrolyzing) [Burkholderiales bacterium]|jgi:asparagine synthase (glutamine-hydrolysing)
MCGVVGSLGLTISEEAAKRAIQQLRHRGPDAWGEVRAQVGPLAAWLGHTRLSILDLSLAGAQPMRSRCNSWLLSFNGEIYNHLELRRELQVEWRGHSDTETLCEALAAWGVEETLRRLNGMFAFAALDLQGGALYLARDPFGIKPLYYTLSPHGIAFASEMRGISALAPETRRIDPAGLQTLLTLRYVPSPGTLLQNVRRVEPGHVLRFDAASMAVVNHHYARPQAADFRGSLDDAAAGYLEHLERAIERQLLSDVPVGLLLSGGIDSALIAACAARAGRALPTYTVGFGDDAPECEIADAKATADIIGLPHHAVTVGYDALWDTLMQAAAAVEEPLGTTSVLPMWHLINRASQDVSVVLTGQGSDEPWGGYRRYQLELLRESFPLTTLARHLPAPLFKTALPEHIERGLSSLSLNPLPERFVAAYELFTGEQRALLTGRGDAGDAIAATSGWLDWVGSTARPAAMKMMHIDARLNLSDDLLLYGDKLSMAFSQEARVPLLDLDLVAFVESLPLSYRARLGATKIAFRLAAKKLLPKEIIQRPKRGFQMPFARLARTTWRERIEVLLLDPESPHLRHLRPEGIKRVLTLHNDRGIDLSRQLFTLINVAVWWRHAGVE